MFFEGFGLWVKSLGFSKLSEWAAVEEVKRVARICGLR